MLEIHVRIWSKKPLNSSIEMSKKTAVAKIFPQEISSKKTHQHKGEIIVEELPKQEKNKGVVAHTFQKPEEHSDISLKKPLAKICRRGGGINKVIFAPMFFKLSGKK